MVASRIRLIGACYPARFWLSAAIAALTPTTIGYQDLAALIAHEHGADSSWHLIASPFGTVQAATFSYSRPIGSAIPEPLGLFQPVNFDPRSLDAFAWKVDEPLTERPARKLEYPSVNRAHKSDRLPVTTLTPAPVDPAQLPQLQPINAPAAAPVTPPAPAASPAVAPMSDPAEHHVESPAPTAATPAAAGAPAVQIDAHDVAPPNTVASGAAQAGPAVRSSSAAVSGDTAGDGVRVDEDASLADKPPELPAPGESETGVASSLAELSFLDDDAADRSAQIYFGYGVMGSPSGLEHWAPGAEPILAPPTDSDIKLAALEGSDSGTGETGSGQTVAGKDITAHLLSPAERLGLADRPLAKAQKCLADAVYFEARGEVLKGQEAVAQVVMNRVFSGYYPHDVCGVVYQNADRHLACQFTFACEGKDLSRIDEPDMWEQAKRIAKDTLDGKIWLAEVGHATHYHAYWVHPSWVHEMAKLYQLGVHTFYRPRNWGDGDDEPVFGELPSISSAASPAGKPDAAATGAQAPAQNSAAPVADGAKSPDAAAAAKVPQAAASPEAAIVKTTATAKL